jgi:hypothetical protein
MQEIEEYQLAWHPTKGCNFRFRIKGTGQWSNWIKVSATDLAGVAAIFNETPVYFNQQTGSIHTGAEPTGD